MSTPVPPLLPEMPAPRQPVAVGRMARLGHKLLSILALLTFFAIVAVIVKFFVISKEAQPYNFHWEVVSNRSRLLLTGIKLTIFISVVS
ncbi:MAG: hypothetical protein ACYDAG_00005, partial [Chloroflexota bacterium]